MASPSFLLPENWIKSLSLTALNYAICNTFSDQTILPGTWIWIRDLGFFTWLTLESQDVCGTGG